MIQKIDFKVPLLYLARSSSTNSTVRVLDLRSTSVVSFSASICLSPSLCRCTLDRKWLEQEQLCYSTARLMAIDNIKVALDSIIQARLVCYIKHTSRLGNNFNQLFGKEPQHAWSCNIENCNKSNHIS